MNIYTKAVSCFFFLLVSLGTYGQAPNSGPFAFQKPVGEKFQALPFGQIKPQGWMREQMADNLRGFTGRLDSIVPKLIYGDDIYVTNRLTRTAPKKDVGAYTDGSEGMDRQFMWWNAETQGNWWDSYIRSALLAGDKKDVAKIKAYVKRILTSQDSTGYLGIYDKEMRYKFDNENGELWAQTVLLRGLLAYQENFQSKEVLNALERAAQNIMKGYPAYASQPFYSKVPDVGGLSHGLMIVDVFERLHQLTGKAAYRNYCAFLYQDFSAHKLNEDGQFTKAVQDTTPLRGHGAHTYEHLRAIAAAYHATGNPELKKALDTYLKKIDRTTTPSGGPAGDEWVGGRTADATTTGYEYCSTHELVHGYADLLAKTGASSYGDKAERLLFNAAQGARNPNESNIAYLKTDNSYAMTGGLNGIHAHKGQNRYKYSPTHQDMAVCCVPNAGRVLPYYVQNMWMRDGNSTLVATLLGPAEVTTTVGEKDITITTTTEYPFDNTLTFTVTTPVPNYVILKIRKPNWATNATVSIPYKEENGYLVIPKKWAEKQAFTVAFEAKPTAHTVSPSSKEVYYTYGALVLARSIPGKDSTMKTHPVPGFRDVAYQPLAPVVPYKAVANALPTPTNKLRFTLSALNPQSGKTETVELQPMAGTILRQVTFKAQD
jgi:DUF1680 family protein